MRHISYKCRVRLNNTVRFENLQMTRETFEANLRTAIRYTLDATRQFVSNDLPDAAKLLIIPSCSFDGNPLEDDEEVFPDQKLPEWTTLAPKTERETIDFLYRGGKVPEWINVQVDSTDTQYSYLVLECCGRFTAMEKNLYHRGGGVPPFNPQVAMPSIDYDLETDGKFELRQRYNKRSEPITGANAG